MTCYSYTSNNPVLLTNVEYVHTVTGSLTYSYNSIAWICEFPESSQLKVYSRASALAAETLLIQGTNYTVNTTTKNIVFASAAPAGELVIRRKTPTDRMLYSFVDGAKLTSTQLNESFNQLLFGIQENIFTNGTQNFYYTVSTGVPSWVSGTSYTLNSIVSHTASGATALYKRLIAGAGTTAPNIDTTNWTVINPSSSGFIIIGGPTVVQFDLSSLGVGYALVWDGSKFVSSTFSGTFASLSGISVAGAVTGDILRYNGTNWANAAPSVTITAANPIFSGRTFYASGLTQSYSNGGTPISPPGSGILSEFKNGSNEWVLTDPITSYRILQKTLPSPNVSGTDIPENFFSTVNSQLVGLAANVTNPVKVKFHWDLSLNTSSLQDFTSLQNLMSPATALWDSPEELYSTTGYGIAITTLRKHGVQVTSGSGRKYYTSPYFTYDTDSTGAGPVYTSKVKGYGVKTFYLSIPDSSTSCLSSIPKMESTSVYFTAPGTVATLVDLITSLNTIGNESAATYRDYYLIGLRDMAFASSRPIISVVSTVKERDAVSRLKKGYLISAEYTGLDNILFKRLEDSGDAGSNCLWKIPKQIIYYNKAALALADKTTASLNTSGSFAKSTVRFSGYSQCLATTSNANTSVLISGIGAYYKADAVWSAWCTNWSTDAANNDFIRFNEADIDWVTQNIATGSTDVNLYRMYGKSPPFAKYNASLVATTSASYFPWHFRPNDIHNSSGGTTDGLIGTHLLNIDANRLFSDAINFMPDPTDEYVYRIVTKAGLLPYFKASGISSLKTSIILEYGFTDHNYSTTTTPLVNKGDIFKNGMLKADQTRVLSRFNKSNTRVYIKHETVETVGSDRYVITLGIQVPRLKSIGYSKVFRKWNETAVYPQRDSSSADAEIDSGPWNFGDIDTEFAHTLLTPNETFSSTGSGSSLIVPNTYDDVSPIDDTLVTYTNTQLISGRNECAVKFTRLGLPTNLWIRLSVLNTDGSVDFINYSGMDVSTNE
jgi:hypothetical protein